jgi:hypothetical protein
MSILKQAVIKMAYAVIAICDKYAAVWNGDIPFTKVYNLLKDKLIIIESFREVQVTETKGVTTEKREKREMLEEKVYYAANRVRSYALANGMSDLAKMVDYKRSELTKARDLDLIAISDTVHSKADENLAGLVQYSFTDVMLNELKDAKNAFNDIQPKVRVTATTSKDATDNINMLVKELSSLLRERMDLDIEVYRTSNNDFYNQYKSARMILGRKGSALAVIASVCEKGSETPVENVHVVFKPVNINAASAVVVEKESSELGHFNIKHIHEGEYDVKISKPGYKEQRTKVVVVKGETVAMEIEMERE